MESCGSAHQEGEPFIVALDGPSGSGKSTVSRAVAGVLGLRYLDTGAMYRALTWWMLHEGVDVHDPAAVAEKAGTPRLCAGTDPAAPTIEVNGVDVAIPIRSRDVTNTVSLVSAVPAVRGRLVGMQRAIIADCAASGIVVEGRDIGSVVAPQAQVKIFLTASVDARTDRRTAEVNASAEDPTTPERTRDELSRRDRLDSSRPVAPLLRAADAIEIDTTSMNRDQVIAAVLDRVRLVLPEPMRR